MLNHLRLMFEAGTKTATATAIWSAAIASVSGSHLASGDIYWGETSPGVAPFVIKSARSDGTNLVTIHGDAGLETSAMFLDREGDKLYFIATATPVRGSVLQRMDVNGTDFEVLYSNLSNYFDHLAGDPTRNRLYFRVQSTDNIFRKGLDASFPQYVMTVPGLAGLSVDPSTGKLYMLIDVSGDTLIRRANWNGSGLEDVMTVQGESPFVAGLACGGGRLYWTNYAHQIRAANVDGTDLAVILTSSGIVRSMFVDDAAHRLYWSEYVLPLADYAQYFTANPKVYQASIHRLGSETLSYFWDYIIELEAAGRIEIPPPADMVSFYLTDDELRRVLAAKTAHAVWLDKNNAFPWRLTDYSLEHLKGLFDPRYLFDGFGPYKWGGIVVDHSPSDIFDWPAPQKLVQSL